MGLDDSWFIVSIAFLIIIIICQAALNLWFIVRNFDLAREATETAALTAELRQHARDRLTGLQERLDRLEGMLAARLDASITMLEQVVNAPRKP